MKHPNAFYIGDTALTSAGGQRMTRVRIRGFVKPHGAAQLVEVEYPDGRIGRRSFSSLTAAPKANDPAITGEAA